MKKITTLFISVLITICVFGQSKQVESFGKKNLNWFNKDVKTDKLMGTDVDKAYSLLLKDMKPKKTVIVAVIDGGVDINHEDLNGRIWINEDEIPNNNIDDDKNGYVDDVNGWNYIGNKSGENLNDENYEYTRIVKLNKEDDKDYKKAKSLYDKELDKQQTLKENIENFESNIKKAKEIIQENTGIEIKSPKDLEKVKSKDKNVKYAKSFLVKKYSKGFKDSDLDGIKKRNNEKLNCYLNKSYNPRSIVGDDPLNFNDRNYGNNNVKGPSPDHGTPVSGIIAGIRDNNKGINGIAESVKIMALRTTPNGDERDKDVALAIIYAVDNGANILNMSFGKQFSPQKEFVDEAVKYAEKHNVLIIHSAGNDGKNLDVEASFPCSSYIDGTIATNFLTVGASDKTLNKTLPAVFSNYGKNNVDIFAPGVDIVSLSPDNSYCMLDGTSFSGPVVSGIAALILSYYPDLTPQQMISLLIDSATKITKPKKVIKPGGDKKDKVAFDALSKSGGVVNVYNALLLAKERYK